MSTDGSAAAPEDTATRDTAGDRPGLGSADPESADSQTTTAETADRGPSGSAPSETEDAEASDTSSVGSAEHGPSDADSGDPGNEGFVAGLLRDATITGLPGETGPPPVEPHAPQAQQEGDEPVGSEPPAGDNPDGVD
jgi:hypothetical protein